MGFDYTKYDSVLSNIDRIDNRINYAIVQQMQEIEKVENIFGNLWWIGGLVVLAIILFFVFKRIFKKDRSKYGDNRTFIYRKDYKQSECRTYTPT
jgi:ABC-type polysaccharide/polyol phosphate export permease